MVKSAKYGCKCRNTKIWIYSFVDCKLLSSRTSSTTWNILILLFKSKWMKWAMVGFIFSSSSSFTFQFSSILSQFKIGWTRPQVMSGNALAQVQRVHKPADLWDITFCTRWFETQNSPGCTCTRRSKFLTHSLTVTKLYNVGTSSI